MVKLLIPLLHPKYSYSTLLIWAIANFLQFINLLRVENNGHFDATLISPESYFTGICFWKV